MTQPPSVHYFDKKDAPSDTLLNVVNAHSTIVSSAPVEEAAIDFEGEEFDEPIFSLDQVLNAPLTAYPPA